MSHQNTGESEAGSEGKVTTLSRQECSCHKGCCGHKFDKDVELKKLDFASEEHRTRYYTAIGWHFSIIVAIAAALISLTLGLAINQVNPTSGTVSVPTPNFWFFFYEAILGIFGAYIFTDSFGIIKRYRAQRPRVNELTERIRNCQGIGTVEQALLFIEGKLVYQQPVGHECWSCPTKE